MQERETFIAEHGLDGSIHHPGADRAADRAALGVGYRTLAEGDYAVVNHLRLFTQACSGFSLPHFQRAEGLPMPTAVPEALEQRLAAVAAQPDDYAKTVRYTLRGLPLWMHQSPPLRFGEMGWLSEDLLLSHDTYAYLERSVLLYEGKVLEWLRRRAAAGHTVRILEIGGGYGALAYSLKRMLPGCRYVIVDLPESLIFSAIYLSVLFADETNEVLAPASRLCASGEAGCSFVANYLFPPLLAGGEPFDLVINTGSMSEMSEAQVRSYCRGIRRLIGRHGMFFEQNPDRRELNLLNPEDLIRDFFVRRQALHSDALPGLTQGAAHLWAKVPIEEVLARD